MAANGSSFSSDKMSFAVKNVAENLAGWKFDNRPIQTFALTAIKFSMHPVWEKQ